MRRQECAERHQQFLRSFLGEPVPAAAYDRVHAYVTDINIPASERIGESVRKIRRSLRRADPLRSYGGR